MRRRRLRKDQEGICRAVGLAELFLRMGGSHGARITFFRIEHLVVQAAQQRIQRVHGSAWLWGPRKLWMAQTQPNVAAALAGGRCL